MPSHYVLAKRNQETEVYNTITHSMIGLIKALRGTLDVKQSKQSEGSSNCTFWTEQIIHSTVC